MKVLLHTKDEVTPSVLEIFKAAKEASGVTTPFEFGYISEDMIPAPHVTVLSLGAYQRRGGERVIQTYSVPQIMSNGDTLSKLAHAFRALAGIYDLPEFNYQVLTHDNAVSVLTGLKGKTLAVDIETKGDVEAQVPSWDEIISLSFYDGETAYVVPEELLAGEYIVKAVRELIESSTCILANGKFDLKYLGAKPLVFEDTMLQHYSLYPAASRHDLKDTAHTIFGAEDWDKEVKKNYLKGKTYTTHTDLGDGAYAQPMKYTAQNGYERIPRDLLYKYNAYDVYWTFHIHTILSAEMVSDDQAYRLYREHLIPLSDMYQEIESKGIRFDIDYMIEYADELTKEGVALKAELNEIGGREINANSPAQVKQWFTDNGLRLKSTDAGTMEALHLDPRATEVHVAFAKKLLEIRKNSKTNGTYITGYLNKLIGDRGYQTFKLHAAITGRLGGGGTSMLTIPRDKKIKRMVLPDEGQVIVSADLSQAELRVMAVESQDPWMLSVFQPGAGDFFDNLISATYSDIDPVDYKASNPGEYTDMRASFKGVVYGVSFGRMAKAIAVSLGISIAEAQELMNAYIRPGSAFAEWRKEIEARAISSDPQAGRLENKFGRKFQAELVTHKNKFNIIRSALSFMSQSTANDICLTAALEVHKKLPDNARIMGTIHDAIYVTCNHEDAKWIGLMLQEEMEKAGKSVYGDQVAFVAEPDMGTNLANGVEFDKITW